MKKHAGIPGVVDAQLKKTLREEMERSINGNSNFTYIKALDGSPGWAFFGSFPFLVVGYLSVLFKASEVQL
jgi:hypothetical protein